MLPRRSNWQIANHKRSMVRPKRMCQLTKGKVNPSGHTLTPPGGTTPPAPPPVIMVFSTIMVNNMKLISIQPRRVSFQVVRPKVYQTMAVRKKKMRNLAFQNRVAEIRKAKEKIQRARGSMRSMMLLRYLKCQDTNMPLSRLGRQRLLSLQHCRP